MASSGEGSNSNNDWSWQQVKAFERGLAYFPDGCAARWEKIATLIPGDKSPQQVKDHYQFLLNDVAAIEAGIPALPNEPIADSSSNEESDSQKGKKRKGEAWTEEEHMQFLLGLERFRKGEWKNIASEFVKTRNATQVASHAQKHFKRQIKDKETVKRWSIFDIASPDGPEQQTGTTGTNCGVMSHNQAPLTVNEAPLAIKETPVVIQQAPFVNQQAPSVNQQAPVIKKTPLVIQEARDGGLMVGPRVESPSISPLERFCLEIEGDDTDSILLDFLSQLSPL